MTWEFKFLSVRVLVVRCSAATTAKCVEPCMETYRHIRLTRTVALSITANSDIFARVIFLVSQKYNPREITLSFTGAGESCPSHDFLTCKYFIKLHSR